VIRARLIGFDGQTEAEVPITPEQARRGWLEMPVFSNTLNVTSEHSGPRVARYRRSVVLHADDTAGETIIVYRREW